MTMTTFARCAPSWMGGHRKAVGAAVLGAIAASVAVAAATVSWPSGDGSALGRGQSTITYPQSREGVRGHVFDAGLEGSGVTADVIQPAAAERTYPASREGVRGHVFDAGLEGSGVTADSIQPASAERTYPASREGVRGHVFE